MMSLLHWEVKVLLINELSEEEDLAQRRLSQADDGSLQGALGQEAERGTSLLQDAS